MKKLFMELEKAGHPAEWDEDGEIEICFPDADFYISKSAGGMYSVKKIPYFAEKEFYAVKTIEEVFAIIEK